MNFLKLAAAILLFSSVANATNIDAKIIKVNKDASKVIVSTTEAAEVTVGDFLSLGTNCELEVIKVPSKNRILLDGSVCEETKFLTKDRSIILVGQVQIPRRNSVSTNTTRTARIEKPVDNIGVVSRGFRIITSYGQAETETDSLYYYYVDDVLEQDSYSIGMSYANIKVRRIGFIGGGTYTHFDTESLGAIRTHASVAFGFAKKFYGYLGGNLNFYTESGYSDYDAQLGSQVGLGFQFNETIGLDISSTATRNNEDQYGIDVDTTIRELTLTITI